MTAREAYREYKMDSPRIGRWLKKAKQRYLPARVDRDKDIAECTCETDGEDGCRKVWRCCDCGREMSHKHGDLLGCCLACRDRIFSNL